MHVCLLCSSDGDLDSLLDSATVDSNEPSPLSSSQESAEERSLKIRHSPKDSNPQGSKASPSSKDTCPGKKQASICLTSVKTLFYIELG